MRVNLQTQTDILQLRSETTALLEGVNKNGDFIYRVSYNVDPIRAARLGAFKVNIIACRQVRIQQVAAIPTFSSSDPRFAINSLLTNVSQTRDAIRSSRQDELYTYVSDITTSISNTEASVMTKTGKLSNQKQKSFELVSAKSITSKNSNTAVLQTTVRPVEFADDLTVSQSRLKSSAQNMLFQHGLDPSSIATKTNLVSTPVEIMGGTSSQTRQPRTGSAKNSILLSSFIDNNAQVNSISLLPQDALVPVAVINTTNYITVEELLEIPASSLRVNEFNFVFELVGQDDLPKETKTYLVEHSKNILVMNTPYLPPVIHSVGQGNQQLSRTTIEIKQMDPSAQGVKVYRRPVTQTGLNANAQYSYVGSLEVSAGEGFRRLDDVFPNMSPVIYRVIPYSKDGLLCGEFSSIVSKGTTRDISTNKAKKSKDNFALLIGTVVPTGIQVDVSNIPTDVVSVQLVRSNLSKAVQDRTLVGAPKHVESVGSSLSFVDNTVKRGFLYAYTCTLIYRDGTNVPIGNQTLIEFQPETTNLIETKIANLEIDEKNNNGIDVRFTIDTSFIGTTEDKIRSALINQGLIEYYNSSISPDSLQNLVAYRVLRTNMSTGQVEDFGVISDTNFSDQTYGAIKGVSALESGFEYSYQVTTHFRSSNTLLASYTKSVTYTENQDKNYSYQPFKWQHPVVVATGNLISQDSLKANYAKDQFVFGQVGKINRVSVSLSKSLPTLLNATANKISSTKIKVQWQVQGSVLKIDHFIVVLDILGNKSIVGKSHNLSESGQFQFIDLLSSGEKGELVYSITPIFYDYTRGSEVKTNKVIV